MIRWLRFFRLPNLLILGATMVMVRFLVIAPHLAQPGIFGLNSLEFACLVAATLLIAAAGYVVNDIQDREIDAANKPDRVFVGPVLSPTAAWKLYGGLNGLALLCATALVIMNGFAPWMLVLPLSAGLLLAYAIRLKCSPLIGNLTVSLLSALVPILVLAAETEVLIIPAGRRALQLGAAYSLFAFAASMFREGVKDLEDAAGDSQEGCRTLAVRDPALARVVALAAMILLGVGLVFFLVPRELTAVTWTVAVSFVLLPAAAASLLLVLARDPGDFRRVSLVAKIIMLGGLALLPLIPA